TGLATGTLRVKHGVSEAPPTLLHPLQILAGRQFRDQLVLQAPIAVGEITASADRRQIAKQRFHELHFSLFSADWQWGLFIGYSLAACGLAKRGKRRFWSVSMRIRQAVIAEPFKVEVRDAELAAPAPNQILVETEVSAVSPGTELAVYTGTHQWLKDPGLPDWKFPFRSGYSAAGTVLAVGSQIDSCRPGDRGSYPGTAAAHESRTLAPERGRLWKLPAGLDAEKAALACILRYGLGASIRAGLTLGRSAAVLGLGLIGQGALRCLIGAGGVSGGGIGHGQRRPGGPPAAGPAPVRAPGRGG